MQCRLRKNCDNLCKYYCKIIPNPLNTTLALVMTNHNSWLTISITLFPFLIYIPHSAILPFVRARRPLVYRMYLLVRQIRDGTPLSLRWQWKRALIRGHIGFYRASICERGLGSRNSLCLSVYSSVCHAHGLWQISMVHCIYFDTTRYANHSCFLTPTIVGGRCPLPSEVCAQSDPPLSRNVNFDRFPLIASQP